MIDYTTSISALVDRAYSSLIDEIAQEGLDILKSLLDSSGFAKSPYLRHYEISAKVLRSTIVYSIEIDFESVEDTSLKLILSESDEDIQEGEEEGREFKISSAVERGFNRARRVIGSRDARRDARRIPNRIHGKGVPAKDARRDARKKSEDRKMERKIMLRSPRSITVGPQGLLAIRMKKSTQEIQDQIRYPQDNFEGVIGQFISEISTLIAEKFAPALETIILRHT